MDSRFKIILSNNNLYKEIELSPDMQMAKVGTSMECDFRLHKNFFFGQIELIFSKNKEGWSVVCSDNLYITVGDVRKLATKQLNHGDFFEIRYQESDNLVLNIEFVLDFDNGKRRYERVISVFGCDKLSIGSRDNCDIIVKSNYVKNDYIELTRQNDGFVANVMNTTYGFYHNGQKTSGTVTIANGDFFSISDYFFYYKNDQLWTEIRSDIITNGLKFWDKKTIGSYPKFNRNTRIRSTINDKKIEILDPPAKPQKPKGNIFSRLLPSLIMVVAGLAMSMVSPFMLISSGIGVVTAIISFVQAKKDFKKDSEDRVTKYNTYIENKKREIEQYRNEEYKALEDIYFSPEVEQNNFTTFSADLFDRDKEDDDFLCVRLGSGEIEAKRKIEFKKQEKLEVEDELQQIPEQIYNQYKNIGNAPIVCDFKNINAIGIVGDLLNRFELFKHMIIDISARHYYSDVKMVFVTENLNKEKVHWARFLPHVFNDLLNIRNIVCDIESKNIIFEYLYKELTYRAQRKSFDTHIVAFFFDEYGFKSHPISRFVENARDLGVTFVFFGNTKADLPLGCDSIIEIEDAQNARLIDVRNKDNSHNFMYHHITTAQAENIVDLLAPVYTEEISLEGTLTKNISLFELLNIIAVDDIDLASRWKNSQIFKSMAAPLGVSKSSIVELDLHDKAHGPHGLVAGTTGSGKSEILQTYILTMSTLFHPYEVAFVIIDFKGGGMVNQLKELPHLLGAITNIDGKEINRSLKSIKAELQKRQRLFADADVNHIDKYIKKFKSGEVSTPIPHLIIIVDEFAELKAEQPEFMKELISAARIGRSLGVHLILATQKPSGQVDDQIWSNSKFKLCLKVQSQQDSNEVLKSPLAAEIKEPGRAYLQVGNNEIFELFQSAYSGAPEKTDDSKVKEFTILGLSDSGRRIPIYSQKNQKNSEGNSTQLDAIVRYVKDYCNQINLNKLPAICLPSLNKVIDYQSGLIDSFSVPIGIYDDPNTQFQGSFGINIFSDNTMIVGSSMTGKTNLLQLVIRGIAENFTPDEVSIYIIDFASMVLKNFEKLNHVGGVVVSNDDEKLKNLFKLLNEEIMTRKEKLLTAGVSNYIAYKEAGNNDIPQIVLIVDNLTALKELHFNEDDLLLPICRDGLSVGISVIIANSQTSGIGFKYLSNFNQRIGFSCNDPAEYHAIFNHCRMQPESVPGRCLIQREKEIYEAQTFISFKGEKEFERVQEISNFNDEINSKQLVKAKKIPVVPEILLSNTLKEEFGVVSDNNMLIIGLNYANVTPVALNYSRQDVLAISGSYNDSKFSFINYLKNQLLLLNTELFVLDDYSGTFNDISEHENVCLYSKNVEDISEMLDSLKNTLVQRYAEREMNGLSAVKEMKPIVLIINASDTANYISENKRVLDTYKDIVKKYKGLKSLIIFTNIENETISYSSPEVLKMMKDNYQFVVFEDLNAVKLFDCPLSLLKKFKTPLKDHEAYFLSGSDLKKIKTVLH